MGTSPLADVPGLSWPRLPALICSRYLTPYCRWDHVLEAGVGTLPEVADGDPPFAFGGAVAQAWSVAEVLRVWHRLRERR